MQLKLKTETLKTLTSKVVKGMGNNKMLPITEMLGINVVAQLQIFYSEYTLRSDLDSRGIDLLEQLPAESNLYTNRWIKLGIKPENALESQALLQLTKEYCANLRCDKCPLRRFLESE